MSNLYIGLMSGTSIDAIDVCLTRLSPKKTELIAAKNYPIPNRIRNEILALCTPGDNEIERMKRLDRQMGALFAEAVLTHIKEQGLTSNDIAAIGSHGQTIRHQPDSDPAFSLQIGDPSTMAEMTGITTVADFRQRDIAAGGQGAPLLPLFHQENLLQDKGDLVLNIGGIANISYINPTTNLLEGFDTGPGNLLMDYWVNKHRDFPFDKNGEWANTGTTHPALLNTLASDSYFSQKVPKSTGRELFNSKWLTDQLRTQNFQQIAPEDVQATLLELTAKTVAEAIEKHSRTQRVIVCGGGARNSALLGKIEDNLGKSVEVTTSDTLGISADWVEAAAFSWFAHNTINNLTSNVPSCTGAIGNRILGGIYKA